MNRIQRKMRGSVYGVESSRGGFTLLEVLLVVGIIALLAAFVVPSFVRTEISTKGKATGSMVSWGSTLATQLELYRSDMGSYPEELTALVEKPDDLPEELEDRWNGPYITDPGSLKDAWGRPLRYQSPGEIYTDRYDLSSDGPDGEEGTDDDIANYTVTEVTREPNG